ncbi:hypothetical protein BV898_11128 [Hypsibius exemplaris]|uniref:Uncharacterized protein n=1 Tax=Hypsibius exemplaris TaxID=2072580 RepID=A0A1W0WHM3_HYPEX|nr:hypothetical protein BV898_11128 [Hypsibius exemplaris]
MDFLRCTIQDAPVSPFGRVSPAVTIDSNGHFADIIRKRFPAHRTSEDRDRADRACVLSWTSSIDILYEEWQKRDLTARFTSRWSLEDAMRQTLTEAMTARCFPASERDVSAAYRAHEPTGGRTDGRTFGGSGGRTDGRTFGGSGGRTDGRTFGRSDRRTDGRTFGGSDGRTDGRTFGRSDGQTGSVTDGRTDRHFTVARAWLDQQISRSAAVVYTLPVERMAHCGKVLVIVDVAVQTFVYIDFRHGSFPPRELHDRATTITDRVQEHGEGLTGHECVRVGGPGLAELLTLAAYSQTEIAVRNLTVGPSLAQLVESVTEKMGMLLEFWSRPSKELFWRVCLPTALPTNVAETVLVELFPERSIQARIQSVVPAVPHAPKGVSPFQHPSSRIRIPDMPVTLESVTAPIVPTSPDPVIGNGNITGEPDDGHLQWPASPEYPYPACGPDVVAVHQSATRSYSVVSDDSLDAEVEAALSEAVGGAVKQPIVRPTVMWPYSPVSDEEDNLATEDQAEKSMKREIKTKQPQEAEKGALYICQKDAERIATVFEHERDARAQFHGTNLINLHLVLLTYPIGAGCAGSVPSELRTALLSTGTNTETTTSHVLHDDLLISVFDDVFENAASGTADNISSDSATETVTGDNRSASAIDKQRSSIGGVDGTSSLSSDSQVSGAKLSSQQGAVPESSFTNALVLAAEPEAESRSKHHSNKTKSNAFDCSLSGIRKSDSTSTPASRSTSTRRDAVRSVTSPVSVPRELSGLDVRDSHNSGLRVRKAHQALKPSVQAGTDAGRKKLKGQLQRSAKAVSASKH